MVQFCLVLVSISLFSDFVGTRYEVVGPDVSQDVVPDVGSLVGPDIGPDVGPLVGPDVEPCSDFTNCRMRPHRFLNTKKRAHVFRSRVQLARTCMSRVTFFHDVAPSLSVH
jgi:hypothetical protein